MRASPFLAALAAVLALAVAGSAAAVEARSRAPGAVSAGGATFVVTGRGWGHGVGMSQWGALGFARRGFSYERIVGHYYPGTVLTRAPVSRVRVLLVEGRSQLTISSASSFRVRDGAGKTHVLRARDYKLGPGLKLELPDRERPQALPGPLIFLPGQVPLKLGRSYRGQIQVDVIGRKLRAINNVGLEAYLYGVVPDEVPHTWPPEALKAQAIAARSYALATRKSGAFDLYDDTRSQVYGGVDAETFPTTAAVDATAARVLAYRGRIAVAYFFSTSGGRTAAIQDAWPRARPVPYLVSVPDPYDSASPHHRWGPLVFSASGVARKLKLPAQLLDLRTTVNASRRVTSVQAVALNRQLSVSGPDIRRALGLRSTWFRIGVLSLLRPAEPATYGVQLALTGFARGVGGVSLEQRPLGGTWERVRRVRPAPDGAFTVTAKPKATADFRLAASGIKAAPVRIPVAPLLRFYPATGRTALGGRMRPILPGTRVEIQRLAGSAWETVATTAVDAHGDFEVRLRLTPGTYRGRAAPGHGLVPGATPMLRIVGA
jgi:stage II sporulation protein D